MTPYCRPNLLSFLLSFGLRAIPAILISLIATSAFATAHEYTLANGLKLVVKEDHRSPVVISQIWYKAGSTDELNGKTGVAHVLEHMMFKGTAKVPGGEFSRRIAAAGGRENAFTSRDYTAYFQQLQKSKLPLAMELESDRMRNLVLTKEEFAKEIRVVMEERRLRTDDQPRALVHEKMMATSYQSHPYRRPVIGWMNDLENMNVDDAKEWYDHWYAPNNAVLVVVGDINPKEIFALAQKYYGAIKPRQLLPLDKRKPQTEPKQVRYQAACRKSSRAAAVSCDGLSCADVAQSGGRLGTLCSRDIGRGARRQPVRPPQQGTGARTAHREFSRRRL